MLLAVLVTVAPVTMYALDGSLETRGTVFNAVVAPVLVGQERQVGPVIVDHAAR